MKISEIKKEALGALNGKWGVAVLATFLYALVITAVPILIEMPLSGGLDARANEQPSIAVNFISILISLALIPFSIAFNWFYLSLSRFDSPRISQLFIVYSNWRTSLKLIASSILMGIFVLLWSLLLIIPGIIKGFAYSQTFFILRDHPEFSIIEAITESRKIMNGFKWSYFLLNLSFIGWMLLIPFTLGIGLLWFIPYITTSKASFYNKVKETL